jgi:hypothetical protein
MLTRPVFRVKKKRLRRKKVLLTFNMHGQEKKVEKEKSAVNMHGQK